MASSDEIPSLADLRRGRGRRREPVARAETPGLFDFFGVSEQEAGPSPDHASEQRTLAGNLGAPQDDKSSLVEETVSTADVMAEISRREASAASVRVQPVEVHVARPAMREPVEARVWSVGDLVRQVRGLVERSYGSVAVEGELSNWRPAASGHCYFTLKDGTAQLSVVMFRRQASLLRFRPKDGDAVRLRGQLSVYESRGQMQLVADTMEQVGLGAMLAAVRELKERLRREGLFERKRPLPAFPKCIGVVTSLQGAALRDIVKVCRRRHAAVRLLIYPAAVQGPNCAREVAAGVRWFSARPELADVLIVARGGGSWEDLHGFDDEGIARAIAACAVPVIVGVGHATDSTIADAAADVCAPTPSAAAELVTAAQYRVEERLERLAARVERAGRYEILRARQRLSRLSAEGALRRVQDGLRRREQRLDELEYRVQTASSRGVRTRVERVARLTARLERQHVALRLERDRRRLESVAGRLLAAQNTSVEAGIARVERARLRLEALNPLRVLERGYALVYGPDGTLLRSSKSVILGERIVARLADGSLGATVFGKKE